MKSLFRSRLFSAVAVGVLLSGTLVLGLSYRAHGQDTTTTPTSPNKTAAASYLRINLDDSFTQEIRLDSDGPVSVATKVRDTDYVITVTPHRQGDTSSLISMSIRKTVHSLVAGKPSAAEQSAQTAQLLTMDGPEREIAVFRRSSSSQRATVNRTTVSWHSQSMF